MYVLDVKLHLALTISDNCENEIGTTPMVEANIIQKISMIHSKGNNHRVFCFIIND